MQLTISALLLAIALPLATHAKLNYCSGTCSDPTWTSLPYCLGPSLESLDPAESATDCHTLPANSGECYRVMRGGEMTGS
jgi:hypothetical protein